MFIVALFTIAKLWKQPRCPTTKEWIKKMWCFLCVWYWVWTQSLHLEPLHQPFFVKGVFKIGSYKLFAQGWLWTAILLISAVWSS
jgi:hypothetical protein